MTTNDPDPQPIHILIVGTGAVGAFYGSRLHQPSNPIRPVLVSLTCRSNYEQVSRHGMIMKTRSFGDYQFQPHRVFPSVSSAANATDAPIWDFVILCTKVLPDLVDDTEVLSPLFLPHRKHPTIVLIQNGVGFERAHRDRFKDVIIITAVTVVNAEQISPGVVRQNRWTRISLGPYVDFTYGGVDEKRSNGQLETKSVNQVALLAELLRQGGIKDTEVYSERDLQLVRWHKLAINASMNPSSILSGGLTNPEMVADPYLRSHLSGCMTEVLNAACKIFGIEKMPSHFASPEEIINSISRAKGEAVKPSMLADWEQKRPLELESILAVPILIAKGYGLRLARLETMYAFLSQLQRRRAGSFKL